MLEETPKEATVRKKCSSCGLSEPEVSFYPKYYRCKRCHYKLTSNWRAKNLQKRRDYEYRNSYGITLEEVECLAQIQDYRCAICKKVTELFVDHDHKTGKVRGLLCRKCNLGIGYLEDNVISMLSAITYLKESI